MSQTEAQQRARKKYLAKLGDLRIRVPQEEKADIVAHAEAQGESLNTFVRRAIKETMKRDDEKKP